MAAPASRGAPHDPAFASQAETARAIVSVLQLRQSFLQRKNIADLGRLFSHEEREEVVKGVRDMYHASEEQQKLQDRDTKKGIEKGKTCASGEKGKAKGGGASQPAASAEKKLPDPPRGSVGYGAIGGRALESDKEPAASTDDTA